MCDGVSAAMAMLSIASAAAGHQAQSKNSKAQMSYQANLQRAHNEAAEQNADNALREQAEASAAERVAEMQNTQAAEQGIFENKQARLKAQGEAVASTMADGTAFDQLVRDYNRLEAQKKDVMKQQLQMQKVQQDFTVSGYKDRSDSRINSQQGFVAAPVNQPSWALTALGIGGDVANIAYRGLRDGGYLDKDKNKTPTTTPKKGG